VKFLDNKYDLVILLGVIPSIDEPVLLQELQESSAKVVHMTPFEDAALKCELLCRYEAGSEEGVVAILSKTLCMNLPVEFEDYFESLDEGYLSAETNIGEDEFEEILEMYEEAKSAVLIIAEDVLYHDRSKNINKFLKILKEFTKLEVISLSSHDFESSLSVPQEVEELKSFDGTVVLQYKSKDNLEKLIGSKQFSVAAKSQNNQKVNVYIEDKVEERIFEVDEKLKGTIALMPVKDENLSYRYKVAKITKREVQ
jgi:NADH-quinone oxidoreductase subunit F